MTAMKNRYDCLVVGGGPAGASTAALVAQSGANTLLLEREKMPRFKVQHMSRSNQSEEVDTRRPHTKLQLHEF